MISLIFIQYEGSLFWAHLAEDGVISLYPVSDRNDFPNIFSEMILRSEHEKYNEVANIIEARNAQLIEKTLGALEYGTFKFENYPLSSNLVFQKRVFTNGDGGGYSEPHAIYVHALVDEDANEPRSVSFLSEGEIVNFITLCSSLTANELREKVSYSVTADISATYHEDENSINVQYTENDRPLNFTMNAFDARLFLTKYREFEF
jgi:hypothetical protein